MAISSIKPGFIGLILCLSVFSCIRGKNDGDFAIKLDSIGRERLRISVITDCDQTKYIVGNCDKVWNPTIQDIEKTDSIAMLAVKEYASSPDDSLRPETYKKYYRQYVCYLDTNGDSIVYINAMCALDETYEEGKNGVVITKRWDWQHQLMVIADGGDCFFTIRINVSRKTFFDFMVNGVALRERTANIIPDVS